MSHEDRYKYGHQHYKRKGNVIGEMLNEVPVVGEIFESLGQAKIGKKGVKKLFCCCAPLALILLVPLIMLVYWLGKSALSLFKMDITNINWIGQIKGWLANTFQFDQINLWLEGIQGLIG